MNREDTVLLAKKNIIEKLWLENNIYLCNTFPTTDYIYKHIIDKAIYLRNLKYAWIFVLEPNISNNYISMCEINKLITKDISYNPGYIRTIPTYINNSYYIPPIPIESIIKEELSMLLNQNKMIDEISIEIMLYIIRKQMFIDGNKRTANLFANKIMIDNGVGIINIKDMKEFYKKIKIYLEINNIEDIKDYLMETSVEKRLIIK